MYTESAWLSMVIWYDASTTQRSLNLAVVLKRKAQNGKPFSQASFQANAILNAFEDSAAASIAERCSLVNLSLRNRIYEPEQKINEVYFPLDCVLSVVARMEDGSEIRGGSVELDTESANISG
jgi:hypothetical protein